MAKYETGIISKNKILNAYRKLFYDQGYKKTTYVDIYNVTGLNQGLITYHFKSKRAIAGQIHTEFRIQIKSAVKEYLTKKNIPYDLRLATSLEQIIYSNLKFTNENLRRFIYEISIEGIFMEYEISNLKDFWDMHVREYNLDLCESEIKMIQVANSSLTWGITTKMIEGYLNVSVEEYIKMRIKLMYQSLGLPNNDIEKILTHSMNIYAKMNTSLSDYFIVALT